MKSNTKIIILSVVVIILALGTYYYLNMAKPVATTSSVAPVVQPTVQTANTSDTQLDQDINTVDSNLNSLNSQSTSVDAAMSQKQVDPSQ